MFPYARHPSTPSRGRGFTLVELLVTVAVAAIMLALAAPMLRDFVSSRAVASQADDLVAALRFARGEAMKRSNPVSVCRLDSAAAEACSTSTGKWQYWMVFVERGNRGVYDPTNVLLRVENAGSSAVDYTKTQDISTYVSFQSTGIALWANQQYPQPLLWTFDPIMSRGSSSYLRAVRFVCLNSQGRVAVVDGNSQCS
ncbi:MAG TPA: GspH/FimT family pseudopilin, partial [Burkholderiaceae bacterium]|nr:GspH/FimT family pseudopilin [Burkholderiaceae bacterium]